VLYESIALKPPFRAENMEGLFKKVLNGNYPPLPNIYSQDLGMLVDALLQKNPHKRPTCEKILSMPIVTKRIEKYFPDVDPISDTISILMSTIKVPRNLLYLTEKLPKSKYIGTTVRDNLDTDRKILK